MRTQKNIKKELKKNNKSKKNIFLWSKQMTIYIIYIICRIKYFTLYRKKKNDKVYLLQTRSKTLN